MAFVLKNYQERCKTALSDYLRRASEVGAKMAFLEATELPYHSVGQLPGLPYVCVRVPTGGGKTILAANAIGIAAKEFLNAEQCLVLWLVPTNTILQQTINALKDRKHPYRLALETSFPGKITVMNLKESLEVERGVLEGETVIIVSTLAALRVEDTEGRKIYESAGALMHHFNGLTETQLAVLEKLGNGDGVIAYSLANVMRLHRPVIVMDEAHNARTKLSFESLARFNPSCIIEFTATPDQKRNPSNVITHVSAAELKAESMIKLPILLKTCQQWKEAVGESVRKQSELERLAKDEEKESGEYLRPIVLFQAQPKSSTGEPITVEVLKKCLLEDFNIPEEEIAIATGEKYELDDVDVLDRSCKLKYIITVAALKEGWDCPFAYILCSVANLTSSTAVEQILGRILRLPKVTWKKRAELNNAYAFATSQRFTDAANALTDALVDSGFAKFEAERMIEPAKGLPFPVQEGPLFSQPVIEPVTSAPELTALPKELKAKVRFEPGKMQMVYVGPPMKEEEKQAIQDCFKKSEDKQAVEKLCLKSNGKAYWPAARGEPFRIPMLSIRVDGQLELFEDQFLAAPWNLADCDPLLEDKEFAIGQAEQLGVVDVTDAGKIEYRFVEELHRDLRLLDLHGPKNVGELALWLDRNIDHPDIVQVQSQSFLQGMVKSLTEKRSITFEQLVAARFRLRDVAAQKIRDHRNQAVGQAFRQMLLPDVETPIEASAELPFTFPLTQYPASRLYDGPIAFNKHYYERPGDMNGEESQCAAAIDSMPKVMYWVRNLERDGYSFWLQTKTDKFYPDFVALLADGRYLAVEYKGGHLMDSKDTEEKKTIGELWEARSKGRCVFRLVGKDDAERELRQIGK